MRTLMLTSLLLVSLPAVAKGEVEVTWLGHAAFELVTPRGTRLLIDPFLSGNPSTPAARKDLKQYKPAAILVSHSHGDHVGDAVAIAKQSGAKVIGSFDFIGTLELPDAQKAGGNVGGAIPINDEVTVHLVPAVHGSNPGGRPLGFVIKVKGSRTLYHSGDTWIFSDMALIHELHKPDVLLLNVGGGPFTQDPRTAALAVKKYFRPKKIVPMHFGTFPPLADEAAVRKAFTGDKRLVVLKPGQSAKL